MVNVETNTAKRLAFRFARPRLLTCDSSTQRHVTFSFSLPIVNALRPAQIRAFKRDGYLVVSDAVTQRQLADARAQLERWTETSRHHRENYGETLDGRPRFDLEQGHSAEAPRLRRVNNPAEVSRIYRNIAFDSALVDQVCSLIGPNIKFLHGKINLKAPQSRTSVGYHQDFSYVPHTNADVITALLALDDIDADNGCLQVVPGSHGKGQFSLWREDQFTGEVSADVARQCAAQAIAVSAKAGDVCLMHVELLHGSNANTSTRERGLYICMYAATDAFLLSPNSLPNKDEGKVVRGVPSRTARVDARQVELPADSNHASFFQLQEQQTHRSKS